MSENLQAEKCHVRWMIERDLPEILAIDDEWTELDFRECLRRKDYIGMIAEVGCDVVGFVIYCLKKSEMHIARLKVHDQWRRKKIGTTIINKLKLKLSSFRRPLLTTVIDDNQNDANDFFRSCGLKAAFMGRSGMIRMQYKLQEHPTS